MAVTDAGRQPGTTESDGADGRASRWDSAAEEAARVAANLMIHRASRWDSGAEDTARVRAGHEQLKSRYASAEFTVEWN
jgi:hypothetical protein